MNMSLSLFNKNIKNLKNQQIIVKISYQMESIHINKAKIMICRKMRVKKIIIHLAITMR